MVLAVEKQNTRSLGRHRVGRTVVFVAAALVLVAVGIRVAVPRPPDVRGLTVERATRALQDAGYSRIIAGYFHVAEGDDFVKCYLPTETVGAVIGQDPCPGVLSWAPKASRIMLWVKVPDPECNAPPGSGCA